MGTRIEVPIYRPDDGDYPVHHVNAGTALEQPRATFGLAMERRGPWRRQG